MGNHRFKLSDMMPNAWFYKLRDMSKLRNYNRFHSVNKSMQSLTPISRKSLYYSAESKLYVSPQNPKFYDGRFLHDPPRKSSSKKRARRKTIYMPSPRKVAPSDLEIPVWLKPTNIQDYFGFSTNNPTFPDTGDFTESPMLGFNCDDPDQSYLSPCSCKLTSSTTDIIIDVEETSYNIVNTDNLTEFDVISEANLPPIQTKPGKRQQINQISDRKVVSLEESDTTSIKFPIEKTKAGKRSSTSSGGRTSFSGGVRLRRSGRKFRGKNAEGRRRKIVEEEEEKKGLFNTESFAIVKASIDPEKDFIESMKEMVMENNISNSKDLEELLACYLSLNSNQYHDLIIKAFKQIWFNSIFR